MFNLEAVVDRMWLDDGHRPGGADEGRSWSCRSRRVVEGIVVACRDAEKSLVRHGNKEGRVRETQWKAISQKRRREVTSRSAGRTY